MCAHRFTWHINIHRYNSITASDHRVGVVIVAAAVGAAAHGDDPLWRGHLVVDLSQGWSHLVCQRARHNDAVGLARRGSEDDAVAIHVVAGRCDVHHFDGAAGQAECEGPQGALFFC